MESSNVFQKKGWSLCNLSCRCFVSLLPPHPTFTGWPRPNGFPSACFSSLIRLYYSVRLSKSRDITYNVGLLGLWSLPEMTSGFLAICLTVSPRFFQSLKHVARPSWISISRPRLDRSLRTANHLSQFNSPTRVPKISTLSRAKQASPSTKRSAGLMSGDPAPIGGPSLSKLEPGSSHILRCIEISTTNEPIDASTPIYPTDW